MINEFKENILRRLKKASLIKKYLRKPEIGDTYGILNQDELQYIIAFSEVIYHTSNRRKKKKLHDIVRNWTKHRTETDGFLKLFRQAINSIQHQTKTHGFDEPFYDLSIAERTKILDKPEYMSTDMYSPGSRNPLAVLKFVSTRIVNHRQTRKFFFLEALRKDLVKGIFDSELGWRLVGHQSWPGVGGEYLAYTQPPTTNQTKK